MTERQTAESGSARYSKVKGLIGLGFDTSNVFSTGADAGLQITGALTLEYQVLQNLYDATVDLHVLLSPSGSPPDSEVNNTLYQIDSGSAGVIGYFHENGAGNNNGYSSDVILPVGQFTHVVVTRASNGTDLSVYLNGSLLDSGSTSNAATGGGNSKLRLGVNCNIVLFSLKITADEFSEAQVLEAYNRTLKKG